MRRIIYAIVLQVFGLSAISSQIVIDNSIFPVAGDTLRSVFTINPGAVDLKNAEGNQDWDFSSITARTPLIITFADATEGMAYADFQGADLVSIIPPNNERYLTVSGSQVAELGFVGFDPVVQEFSIASKYESPYVVQQAPLAFGDTYSTSTKLVTTLPFDSIPDTLVMGLPISPDSIRVNVNINRDAEVDAWGKMTTPAGTYDVLREKSIETRTTEVEAFTRLFGWSPVTDLIRNILPDPSLLDPINTEAYVFYSNQRKEPIASVSVDSNGMADRVQMYSSMPVSTSDQYSFAEMKISPNPTYGKTHLYYSGIPAGDYELWVYDILGNTIAKDKYTLQSEGKVKCDYTYLKKGTYLYSLKDSNGSIISTKRMVILSP